MRKRVNDGRRAQETDRKRRSRNAMMGGMVVLSIVLLWQYL